MNEVSTNAGKGTTYVFGAWITGLIVFLGVWLYALSEWGFLFGLIFGWIPALIAGVVMGFLWPIVAVSVIIIAVYLGVNNAKTAAFNKKVEECILAQQEFNPYREGLTETRTQKAFDEGWSTENIQKGIATDKLRNSKWLEETRKECQTQIRVSK